MGIFLAKGIKKPWQKFIAHADAIVCHHDSQPFVIGGADHGKFSLALLLRLDNLHVEIDIASRLGKLNGIAENVQHDALKLQLVSDNISRYISGKMSVEG